MKVYRYPIRTLAGDYLRAAAGFSVGVGLMSLGASTLVITIGTGIAGLFSLFGCRTLQRHVTKVAVDDREIRNVAFGTRVMGWADLERFKLRYYGTKRQEKGSEGFMQLTLYGGSTSLIYDSGLEGFDFVTWRAAKALRENGRSPDPTTAGNLLTLGLDGEGAMPLDQG